MKIRTGKHKGVGRYNLRIDGIKDNDLGSIYLGVKEVLKDNNGLYALILMDSNLTGESGVLFSHLVSSNSIRELNINSSVLKEDSLGGLNRALTKISYLSLHHNNIKEAEALNLFKILEENESLRSLDLSTTFHYLPNRNCLCKKRAMEALASYMKVSGNETLEHLNLDRCAIENRGQEILFEALKDNKTLVTLDLNNNNCGYQNLTPEIKSFFTNNPNILKFDYKAFSFDKSEFIENRLKENRDEVYSIIDKIENKEEISPEVIENRLPAILFLNFRKTSHEKKHEKTQSYLEELSEKYEIKIPEHIREEYNLPEQNKAKVEVVIGTGANNSSIARMLI